MKNMEKSVFPKNEKHHNWKGEDASLVAKHVWIIGRFGKPTRCDFCARDGLSGKFINWVFGFLKPDCLARQGSQGSIPSCLSFIALFFAQTGHNI